MGEKVLSVEGYDPLVIFGANENKLEFIRSLFPQLKIIVRGEMIKLVGTEKDFKVFESYFDQVLLHIEQFETVSETDLKGLALSTADPSEKLPPNDILVHGRNGAQIKARTENQRKMVSMMQKNDMLFAVGPAGTGKTESVLPDFNIPFTSASIAVHVSKKWKKNWDEVKYCSERCRKNK